ncbi:MAG TPA: GGDEF domain-containing protein [Candidatus Dormibacteraeota bacterium]|nr:GGDEF domain-containing protein [Candidatus Dormibacteraeota bacterium]
MTTATRARLYRAAVIAPGVASVAVLIFQTFFRTTSWSGSDLAITLVALPITVALAYFATSLPRLRSRRVGFGAEGYLLDVPIFAPLLLASPNGGAIAAGVAILGFSIAAYARRAEAGFELLRHAFVRAAVLLLVAALLPVTSLGSSELIRFAATTMAIAAAYELFLAAPLLAIARGFSIRRTILRYARMRRLWLALALTTLWASVDHAAFSSAGAALGIALWLPLPYIAWLLWSNEHLRGELSRLRLVRDAVAAMLAARDPLPQMRSILGSLRRALVDETLEIVTRAEGSKKKWQSVASVGAPIGEAGQPLRARLLARLPFEDRESTKLADGTMTLSAYAIRAGDSSVGALLVYRRRDDISSREHQQFYHAAHDLAPLLVDLRSISEARSAANTDSLTGIFNRRAILERLTAIVDEPQRNGAILMLDIDRFKGINDALGHAVGDEVLRHVTEVIRAAIRVEDALGRIGGEEFLVVMPDATRELALAIGERVRANIAKSDFTLAKGLDVTISIGVATVRRNDRPAEVLERADRALYEAKRTGRNRLVEEESA